MSHTKRTQLANKESKQSSHTSNRIAVREHVDARPNVNGRSHIGAAQTIARPVATRTGAKHTDYSKLPTSIEIDSYNLLERSLSKLRSKGAIPTVAKEKVAQLKRRPLQPTSTVPQAAPSALPTRIFEGRSKEPAFVVHDIPSSRQDYETRQDQPLPNGKSVRKAIGERICSHLHGSVATRTTSPARDKDVAGIRMKAKQLGIFKISEADLKERYRFLNEIGAGEWGSVWSAEALLPLDHLPTSAYRSLQIAKLTGTGTDTIDNSPNFRPLAVKLCKRETKYSAAARTQRLWNEFKVLRTLMEQLPRAEAIDANSPNCRVRNDRTGWHPNVVNFYEFLLTPNLAMLVMPKFDEPMKVCLGDTLCRNYFQQLLSALHWLHQHCVCHNDIKVDNLGVTYDTSGLGRDTVTLFDFGFANRYDPLEEGAFMSKEIWGTPEYLAPERSRGVLHDERKSDIWALGITFFEMLTGRTPFEHHDEKFDTKDKFQEYYARAERGIWLGEWEMSSEMEDLIRKMLRHDPQERIDAADALLHTQFDPQNGALCDSFDELLQFSYEDTPSRRAAGVMLPDAMASPLEELDDSDAKIEELLAQTERLEGPHPGPIDTASLLASPGVSRAVTATHPSLVQGSPTLSQVGMDSRLTDLMCVSPPWRGVQPPRQDTPIPSAQRDRLLAETLKADSQDEEDDSDASVNDHLPVAADHASRASYTKPRVLEPLSKQSPFRLRVGERARAAHVLRPAEEQASSTPVSAPANNAQDPSAPVFCPKALPNAGVERLKINQMQRTEAGSRGNVVASLAKKFDASNFLARPPTHVTALGGHTGLGLTIAGGPVAKLVHGHRRSKSYTLTGTQQGFARRVVRRSTGSYSSSPEKTLPRCARRLFEAESATTRLQRPAELENAVDKTSIRSDTEDAGAEATSAAAADPAPRLHAALSADEVGSSTRSEPHKRLRSPSNPNLTADVTRSTASPGEEVIFKKLKKMASLAGMLTRMIDETKSTIMSPSPTKTPMKGERGRASVLGRTAMDGSPCLLETPLAREREEDVCCGDGDAEVSMVSAAYSLDLSGSAPHDSLLQSEPAETELVGTVTSTAQCSPQQLRRQPPKHTAASRSLCLNPTSFGMNDAPSPAQVETMYSSFLLSQNVSKSGSGFLSPATTAHTPTSAVSSPGVGAGKNKHCSLAALFAPSSGARIVEHLAKDAADGAGSSQAVVQTPVLGATTSPSRGGQRGVGKAAKLARLFRKHP